MEKYEKYLLEEYDNLTDRRIDLLLAYAGLKKGSIQKKKISGHDYYYLVYREKDKVKTDYLPQKTAVSLKQEYKKAKENKQKAKELDAKIKDLERALNSSYAKNIKRFSDDEFSDEIYLLSKIKILLAPIFRHYKVKKVTLFGSYAKGKAHSKSDVDMAVETDLRGLDFIELSHDLRKALGKSLDVISINEIESGSKVDKEIQKTGIVIYAG